MEFIWVYFLDDSSEEWLNNMPTGAVLTMTKDYRNFLVASEFEEISAAENCTVTPIENSDHLGHLMAEI